MLQGVNLCLPVAITKGLREMASELVGIHDIAQEEGGVEASDREQGDLLIPRKRPDGACSLMGRNHLDHLLDSGEKVK